jgi:uncharacterized protein (DUF58 family)
MAASTRRLEPSAARPAPAVQQTALDLARVIPRLTIEARRVATAAAMGVHGRRRAGVGENFWQFRHFSFGESAARVDWRRSARDDHLYVREREWEAVHTVWLWIDRSASMLFQSNLAPVAKVERALVLGFALSDLLVRGGERVGLIGSARPTAARDRRKTRGDAPRRQGKARRPAGQRAAGAADGGRADRRFPVAL